MSYPFVAAKFYTPGGMVEPRAIAIHFAEGGGTVSWLTHPYTIVNGQKVPQDNSSHFIIERGTGRTVQMVKDADASHSLHVARPYGPPGAGDYGIYSLDVAKACLGAGIADPCAYIFAIELEGTAAEGPDAAQAVSLVALVRDLRARHLSLRGLLGHRDFQNYKVCPGGKIPWSLLGGHGLFNAAPVAAGGDMAINTRGLTLASSHAITLPDNTVIYESPGPSTVLGRAAGEVPYFGSIGAWKAVRVNFGQGSLIGYTDTSASVYAVPAAPIVADSTPFSKADLDAEVAADRLKAHVTWQA